MNNHQLEFGETKLKLSKFWLMLHNSFQIFGCVFILYRIFHEGPVADFTGVYSKEDTKIERIFKWLELAPFLELVHHLIGISKMKTHIFVGMLINIWILAICHALDYHQMRAEDYPPFLQCLQCYGPQV
ncbi:hypothetical protein FGO68_gene15380 [Halteria grandinella]|uniref:Very-long-chain (3R)-3-hydroxyacyl-CoA dehydratase n=1 Tax=Halteria grandinella TaxID=5974 RepID=A0A8J8NC69_HALGN|nr:hypothetical protein FGO68_gene15380 [Halteria grandinella]